MQAMKYWHGKQTREENGVKETKVASWMERGTRGLTKFLVAQTPRRDGGRMRRRGSRSLAAYELRRHAAFGVRRRWRRDERLQMKRDFQQGEVREREREWGG